MRACWRSRASIIGCIPVSTRYKPYKKRKGRQRAPRDRERTAGVFRLLQGLDKGTGPLQVIRIRVALGHAADELKRAKGIITAAGEGAKNGAIFGLYCFGDGGIILFWAGSGAMGTDEKGFFALGQVLGGVMDHGIVEFGVIDAGGEADAVILRQAGGHAAGDIDEIDLGGFSHVFQDLEGIAMVAGIITDGGFHVGASLGKVIKWCRSRGQAASKTPTGPGTPTGRLAPDARRAGACQGQ